jgi:SM-20-related protein
MSPQALGAIADGVADSGFAICEGFLPVRDASVLAAEATALWRAGSFAPAGVGKRAERRADERGDHILWLEEAASAAQRRLLARLEALRLVLNRELTLGLLDFEGHFSFYPPGAAYGRHFDRFASDPARTVSLIVYLNRGWRPEDGGALRLYDGDRHVDVLPEAGTLALFLSDRFEHEVLRVRRERLAFAGWFRRRA